jgi:hypothetical protein
MKYSFMLGLCLFLICDGSAQADPKKDHNKTGAGDLLYAIPIKGKPGFVLSPYKPDAPSIDIRGFPPKAQVRCPYTHKIFLVPASAVVKSTTAPLLGPGMLPYATPIRDKPGFVLSPYAPNAGYVDVRGFPRGTEIKCPYTQKIFLAP